MSVQQPLMNPVQFPIPITSLTRDNNQPTATATATTKWAHGMSVAQTRAISGATQSEYNSAGLTVTPINATQFTYGVSCTLWATTASGTAAVNTAMAWSFGTTFLQSGAAGSETHFFAEKAGNQISNFNVEIGDSITISGTSGGLNIDGTYSITSATFDGFNTFMFFTVSGYTGAANTGQNGTVNMLRAWPAISSVTAPLNTPTTTATLHTNFSFDIPSLISSTTFTISGLSPSQYNANFSVSGKQGTSVTTLTYTINCPGDIPATPATGTIKVT